MIRDPKNHGPFLPLSFNPEPEIGNKPENQDYIKIEINTQTENINRKWYLYTF